MSKYDILSQFECQKAKSEKRKTKSEKRKTKSEKQKAKRKTNQLHLATFLCFLVKHVNPPLFQAEHQSYDRA